MKKLKMETALSKVNGCIETVAKDHSSSVSCDDHESGGGRASSTGRYQYWSQGSVTSFGYDDR